MFTTFHVAAHVPRSPRLRELIFRRLPRIFTTFHVAPHIPRPPRPTKPSLIHAKILHLKSLSRQSSISSAIASGDDGSFSEGGFTRADKVQVQNMGNGVGSEHR